MGDIMAIPFSVKTAGKQRNHMKRFPDLVFIHCGDVSLKNQIINSALSYINAVVYHTFQHSDGDVFDHPAVAVRRWKSSDIDLPHIYVYSDSLVTSESDRLSILPIGGVLEACHIDPYEPRYIPVLKGALLYVHAQTHSEPFILSDADITYHSFHSYPNERDIYFSGIEFSPFTCFYAQKSTDDYRKQVIEQYKADWDRLNDIIKLDLHSWVLNNGVCYVPHVYITNFYHNYYQYLSDIWASDEPLLQVPKPFWVAEMFAMNYAALQCSFETPCRIKRFDPDIGQIYHDVPKTKSKMFDDIFSV